MNRIQTLIVGGLAALLVAGAAVSGEMVSAEQIERASTAADHQTIAAAYDREADAALQQADSHARMALTYRTGTHKGPATAMARHCERLQESYRSAADAYRQLAEEHRQLAAQAQ
jgi:hypothetical protein